MPANFDVAISFVLENERGMLFVDANSGEYSRYGITLKFAAAAGLCTPDDKIFIERMTATLASAIYLKFVWEPHGFGLIAHQQVATKLLDMCVNMGTAQAVKLAQRALAPLGRGVTVDGVLGRETIAALNAADEYELVQEMRAECCAFYGELANKNPERYGKYLKGWEMRARK